MPARRPGFSIVELVVVLAVGALLAGVAVPRMADASTRYRADFAARQVAGDLDRARAAARLTGVAQSVTFDLTQHRYTVTGTAAGSTAGTVVRMSGEPHNARITAASFAGAAAVTFTPYGDTVPAPAAGAAAVGTVTLRVGGLTRTVTLDAGSGRARWQ